MIEKEHRGKPPHLLTKPVRIKQLVAMNHFVIDSYEL